MEQNSTKRNVIFLSIALSLSVLVVSLLHSKDKQAVAKVDEASSSESVTTLKMQN